MPQAFVGLHARAVVLISLQALRLLTEEELRALVAHETGHEYVHAEYERATAAGRNGRLQELELVCDIIAVVTLHAIGQKASSLVAGIEKLLRFDRHHFGRDMEHPDYPSPLLRRSVVLRLEQRISASRGWPVTARRATASASVGEGRHERVDLLEDFAGIADEQVMPA